MFLSSQIDPKRAIPREEQEKTSKIFVGGVSQEATEHDFKQFFMQFGRVVDATLMMDKDTGRPRGFGFVTFDSEAAVERTLQGPLEILGKPIEVKKAQPRGNLREEENTRNRNQRGHGQDTQQNNAMQDSGQAGQGMMANGMSPQMMAQYWQRMQQYFAMMQQQMATAAMANGQAMGMGGMNPMMMQQMQQMQQAMGSTQQGSPSPGPQNMQRMNPQMMQQMQNMQRQMQGGMNPMMGMGGMQSSGSMSPGPAMGPAANRPGYNAQEQLAFEQQKYEQQQVRRSTPGSNNFSQNPTSWEGMYDDVPQPNMQMGGTGGRGGPIRNTGHNPAMNGKAPKGPSDRKSTL